MGEKRRFECILMGHPPPTLATSLSSSRETPMHPQVSQEIESPACPWSSQLGSSELGMPR